MRLASPVPILTVTSERAERIPHANWTKPFLLPSQVSHKALPEEISHPKARCLARVAAEERWSRRGCPGRAPGAGPGSRCRRGQAGREGPGPEEEPRPRLLSSVTGAAPRAGGPWRWHGTAWDRCCGECGDTPAPSPSPSHPGGGGCPRLGSPWSAPALPSRGGGRGINPDGAAWEKRVGTLSRPPEPGWGSAEGSTGRKEPRTFEVQWPPGTRSCCGGCCARGWRAGAAGTRGQCAHNAGPVVIEPAASMELQLCRQLGNTSAALLAALHFMFEQENHAAIWLSPKSPD